jgi:hypothetical protein
VAVLTFLALAAGSLLLAALAPVALLYTLSAPPPTEEARTAHNLLYLLHTAFVGGSGLAGMAVLWRGMRSFGRPARAVFFIWIAAFALAGGEVAWALRPFVGSVYKPVVFLRPDALHGNVYEFVFTDILPHLLGGPQKEEKAWKPPLDPEASPRGGADGGKGGLRSFDRLLTEPQSIAEASSAPGWLLGGALVGFLLYGAVAGLFQGGSQILVSAFKAPIIVGLALALCLPSLYVFSALSGARWSKRQLAATVSGFAATLGLADFRLEIPGSGAPRERRGGRDGPLALPLWLRLAPGCHVRQAGALARRGPAALPAGQDVFP